MKNMRPYKKKCANTVVFLYNPRKFFYLHFLQQILCMLKNM